MNGNSLIIIKVDLYRSRIDLCHFQLEELGRLVVNLCSVVPGGIVLFFPSYDYEQLVSVSWEKSGILGRIEAKKKV